MKLLLKRPFFWLGIFFLVLGFSKEIAQVHAQSAAAYTMAGTASHSTCLTPAAGQYFLCVANDGIWVSNNGTAYFQITAPAASAGITSVNVCNALGANCSPAAVSNGAVNLNIPTKVTVAAPSVTSTAGAPGATLQ